MQLVKRIGPICLVMALLPAAVFANEGRILATGGLSQIEGSAGGGLVPWAVMAGYGEQGEYGGTVSLTRVDLADYSLGVVAANWSWNNRIEFSVSRGQLDLGTLGLALDAPDAVLRMNTFGMKTRLGGDLIYGQLPQFAFGLQYKDLRDPTIPELVGAQRDSDLDAYLAVSRLFLGAG